MTSRLYLFQEGNLVFPGDPARGTEDGSCDSTLVKDFFSQAVFFEVPALDTPAPIRFAVIPQDTKLPPHWKRTALRQVLNDMHGRSSAGRLLRAFHIAQWRQDSCYCGSCGGQNIDAPDELARLCPVCGRREYPRIAPAVITLIVNDEGQALLAHNKKFIVGMYSLIAGFNEAGESLEDTVAREIREEVGLAVKDIRYIASQPWPFPNSLMLGFTARYAGGTIRPDGDEIEDARWFSRNDLPLLPGHGSVSRCLIEQWIAEKM